SEAGELHGLVVIEENIQDDTNNITRFLVISNDHINSESTNNKTSIILETSNKPGSLADALMEFKIADINIDLLHSSFVANSNFTMKFFLEYDAAWQSDKSK